MTNYLGVSLADTYGRGLQDRQSREINQLNMDSAKEQNALAKTDRAAANSRAQLEQTYAGLQNIITNPQATPQVLQAMAQSGLVAPDKVEAMMQEFQANPQGFMQKTQGFAAQIATQMGQAIPKPEKPDPRRVIKDPNQVPRYEDTKEPVYPGIEKTPEPVKPEKPDYGPSDDLRTEFTDRIKDFYKVNEAYSRVIGSATDPSPAGDLALIFNYMKILDPGSTVREGEFANAQSSGSVPQKIWSMYNQVLEGTRLSEPQRGDFVKRADMLYKKQSEGAERTANYYKKIATSRNLNPDDVIGEYSMRKDIAGVPESAPVNISSDAEYDQLPSGAVFIGPDGQQRRKP